jgi:hypothetical protein
MLYFLSASDTGAQIVDLYFLIRAPYLLEYI